MSAPATNAANMAYIGYCPICGGAKGVIAELVGDGKRLERPGVERRWKAKVDRFVASLIRAGCRVEHVTDDQVRASTWCKCASHPGAA